MITDIQTFLTSPSIVWWALGITASIVLLTLLNPRRIGAPQAPLEPKNPDVVEGRVAIPLVISMAFGTGLIWLVWSYKDAMLERWRSYEFSTAATAPSSLQAIPLEVTYENRPALKPIPLVSDSFETWPLIWLRPGEVSKPIRKERDYEFMIDGKDLFLHCELSSGRRERLRIPSPTPPTACQECDIPFMWIENARNEMNSFSYAFRPLQKKCR